MGRPKKIQGNVATSNKMTPATVEQADFGRKIREYETLLSDEVLARDEATKTLQAAHDLLREHKLSTAYGGKELPKHDDFRIFKPLDKTTANYKLSVSNVGYDAQNMINRSVNPLLKEYFGEETFAKIKKLSDVYSTGGMKSEVDEVKTAKFKAEYEPLRKAASTAQIKLENIIEKKRLSKEYVSYVKDIASIASARKLMEK